MSDVRVHARVVIKEVRDERTYLAALPNGKIILAFGKRRDGPVKYEVGEEAFVLLSLCDFSEGQLVPEDLSGMNLNRPIIDQRGEPK